FRSFLHCRFIFSSFFFQAEDGIRDDLVTGVQTCALPIFPPKAQQASCPSRGPDIVLRGACRRRRERRVGRPSSAPASLSGGGCRDRKSVVKGESGVHGCRGSGNGDKSCRGILGVRCELYV